MAELDLPDTAVEGELEHITDHNKIVTAITTVNADLEAVETELGDNPSGTYSTVAERLAVPPTLSSFDYRDISPTAPDAMDDEFNDGVFNTGLWTDLNIGPVTKQESGSALTFVVNENINHLRGIYQTVPAGAWIFRAKILPHSHIGGTLTSNLFVAASPTGQVYDVGIWSDGAPSVRSLQWASPTSAVAAWATDLAGIGCIPIYVEAEYDGSTAVVFRWSPDGEFYYPMGTTSGFTPGIIGLGMANRLGVQMGFSFDWFRRVA